MFDGSLSLYWVDVTNGAGVPSPTDIMSRITQGFSDRQLGAIHQLESVDEIAEACPQNFNLFSECFAALSFNTLPTTANASIPLNYTIHADGGLFHVDVVRHTSDYEIRVMPLQWAIDSVCEIVFTADLQNGTQTVSQAIIELRTGELAPTPLEWPYTIETNKEQFTELRLSAWL